jgi:phospholipid/cholesterol/gamma-HCH transport system substrate-binding protein
VSRSLTRFQAVFLGAVVFAGLGLGAWGLFQVGERQRLWSDTFTVQVGFGRLQGVSVGTPVRIRGLEAGVVSGVDLPETEQADEALVLRLTLDRRFQHLLFADASACILNEGMVGGRVIEIEPGRRESGPLADGARIASHSNADLSDLLKQTQTLLADVRDGQGTLGRLLKDDRAYTEVVAALEQTKQLMQKSQDAVQAVKQDADAIKRLPIVRSYVDDHVALLVRPTHERHRQVLAADALFEPGRAVLTDAGRTRLDEVASWLNGLKVKGSDIVVVSYADPKAEPSQRAAAALTQKRSEVVCEYLKDQHKVHKLSLLRRRDVKPIGLGTDPPIVPETEPVPPARTEVLVFVPQASS